MKIGDLLLLKLSGTRDRSQSCGIYLGRERSGKEHLTIVFTLRGTLKLKRNAIQKVDAQVRYVGDTADTGAMRDFIKKHAMELDKQVRKEAQRLEVTPGTILKQVRPVMLWRSVVGLAGRAARGNQESRVNIPGDLSIPPLSEEREEKRKEEREESGEEREGRRRNGHYLFAEPIDVEAIARIYFHPKVPGKSQVDAVAEVLKPCRVRGSPYFARGPRGNNFLVYTSDAMKHVEAHINLLNQLKGRFVELVEEEVAEPDPGAGEDDAAPAEALGAKRRRRTPRKRKIPRPVADDPAEVHLSADERAAFEQLARWARAYFEHGGWERVEGMGLGGTPVLGVEGFSLPRYLEFFGSDLAGERLLEAPSALLEFLLRTGFITWREASELLIRLMIARREIHFSLSFPPAVQDEAKKLPTHPSEDDCTARRDLRDHECYTIDPVDAKDFDDAVGFRVFDDPSAEGQRRVELHVHIADVTHYVRPGSSIDQEARCRCTSVYLPTGVLPMLPAELSENLCSLREGQDTLAFTTRMIFDANSAELLEWEHFRSVIRVRENLSYDQVNDKIALNDEINGSTLDDGIAGPMVEDTADSLFTAMSRFSERLAERHRRLDIVTEERKIRFSPDGNRLDVMIKSPSPATRMIEQFMVVTNEVVARTIHGAGLPSVYRIHPLPDRPDVERWNAMCAALGFGDVVLDIDFRALKRGPGGHGGKGDEGPGTGSGKGVDLLSMLQSGGTLTLGGFWGPAKNGGEKPGSNAKGSHGGEDNESGVETGSDTAGSAAAAEFLVPMDPHDLEMVGEAYRGALAVISSKEAAVRRLLYDRMLSTMARAAYAVHNHGHFGLNSLCYTHFTSPIRRYADVLVHRVLAAVIEGGEEGAVEGAKENDEQVEWPPGTGSDGRNSSAAPTLDELKDMVEMCNDQSRAAEALERLMIDVALATRTSLDREFRRHTHRCTITGLTPASCFLSLDDAIEGRIPLSRMSPYRISPDESLSLVVLNTLENEGVTDERSLKEYLEKRRSAAHVPGGEEEKVELYRLGQELRCRIHSVEIAEGKVELSLAGGRE